MSAVLKMMLKDVKRLKLLYLLLAIFFVVIYSMVIMGADSLIYEYNNRRVSSNNFSDKIYGLDVYSQSFEPIPDEIKLAFNDCYSMKVLTWHKASDRLNDIYDQNVYLINGDISLLKGTDKINADRAGEDTYVVASDTLKNAPTTIPLDHLYPNIPVHIVNTAPLDQIIHNNIRSISSNEYEPKSTGNIYILNAVYPDEYIVNLSDSTFCDFLSNTYIGQNDPEALQRILDIFEDSSLKIIPRDLTYSGTEIDFLTTFFFPYLGLAILIFFASLLAVLSGFLKETSKRSYIHYLCGGTLGKIVSTNIISLVILFIPAFIFSHYLVKLRELSWYYLLAVCVLHVVLIALTTIYQYFTLKDKYFVQILRGI